MSIILKRLPIGYFVKDFICPPDTADSFKIYALYSNNQNTTFEDIRALSKEDKSDARESFIKFQKFAVTGRPFHETFEGSQFHTGHEFDYRGNQVTIRRLWLAGKIRIYFLFFPDRRIAVLKTLAKREQNLSKSEEKKLERIAKQVIDCFNSNLVTTIEIENKE